MTRSRTSRIASVALMLLTAAILGPLLAPATAEAHTGDQSYLYVDVGESVDARVQMPFGDVEEHLGIVFPDGGGRLALEGPDADALIAFALEHAVLGQDGATWALENPQAFALRGISYAEVTFDVIVDPDALAEPITLTFDPFFDENPERDALFIIANDLNRGVIDNESESLVRFTPDNRTQTFDLGDSSWWNNFTASIAVGMDHIRTGPDHILFIAALLLPSVLVWSTAWRPTDSFGASLWRVLKVMTMFTLAHSVTFTLAGLDLIPGGNSTLIESIIAISIGVAALHNLYPVMPEREWLIAFVFGLIHGFGFASLVGDLDVSRSTQLLSLVARNIGIEIAQVIVVVLVFPILYLLRRTRYYDGVFRVGSIVLIVASLGWAAERLFDAPDWTSRALDEALAFPRVLLILAVAAAAAAALYKREEQADQLVPVAAE